MDSMQLRGMGFKYMDNPHICDKGRLKFNCKPQQFQNIVYAILVNDKLVYIGLTKDFYTRVHTYRNALYWKNAFRSNKRKTHMIENAVMRGRDVSFYCLNSANMEYDERLLIKHLNPKWNKVFCKSCK